MGRRHLPLRPFFDGVSIVMRKIKVPVFLIGQFCLIAVAPAQVSEVAGLRPYQRPVGAPVVERFEQSDAWRAQALKGVGEPRTGLGFLSDQGPWYTPFNRPNLQGRYDIRQLHDNDKKKD